MPSCIRAVLHILPQSCSSIIVEAFNSDSPGVRPRPESVVDRVKCCRHNSVNRKDFSTHFLPGQEGMEINKTCRRGPDGKAL